MEDTQSEMLQADFFAENPDGPFDLVYERIFLCSLPKTLWPSYAAQNHTVPPHGRMPRWGYTREAALTITRLSPSMNNPRRGGRQHGRHIHGVRPMAVRSKAPHRPMFIHATVPPDVETMNQLKSKITYEAENTVRGAQLRIITHDAQALTAIHSFLRFQIQDHQTGDSLEVKK
jgi:hypothetical protein